MNKRFFSLLMISAALCATAGCGKKKQPKAIEQSTYVKASADKAIAQDSKEDYTIAA